MRLLAQGSAHALPLRDESVQTVVTSPPYWGLRQYAGEQSLAWGVDQGHAHEWGAEIAGKRDEYRVTYSPKQQTNGGNMDRSESRGRFCACGAWHGALGLEPTPELYVAHMVEVFREVWRVLRDDGTLWLNLGDSYANGSNNKPHTGILKYQDNHQNEMVRNITRAIPDGLKPKDLVGIPWRVAFALQADGWYLRQDIIWHKPNPMPESVTDRCTKAHEYIFLLTKSARYYYDHEAVNEPAEIGTKPRNFGPQDKGDVRGDGNKRDSWECNGTRNRRSVWTVPTQPFAGAHFATFPEALVEPCILAGSAPKACVLDPFAGSGTTVRVANRLGRVGVGLDISREYLAEQALARVDPLAAARRDHQQGKSPQATLL